MSTRQTPLPTRAALVTPKGRGAVSSIVVSGPEAGGVVESLFRSASRRRLTQEPLGRILFGTWSDTGEEIVVARRGESRVEIHCHGGTAAPAAILNSLAAAGCKSATWQELVADDEPSPIRAMARMALAECRTERAAAILLDQYLGALDEAIGRIVRGLTGNDTKTAVAEMRELASWTELGRHLTTPWRIVIAGPPNVGKSTLVNALVGYERAIVFDQPGTTRDVVTAQAAIDGWAIELADTAGLRAAAEPLEQAGVLRTENALKNADLAVLVYDVTQPWTLQAEQLAAEHPNAILVHNKADLRLAGLVRADSTEGLHKRPINDDAWQTAGFRRNLLVGRRDGIVLSAKTGWNVTELIASLATRLAPRVPAAGTAIPFTAEQAAAIEAALDEAGAGRFDVAAAILARLVAAATRQ